MRSFARAGAVVALFCAALAVTGLDAQEDAARLYTGAVERERALRVEMAAHRREATSASILRRIRSMVGAYEEIVRRFPRSGYSDNALWQGAVLLADAYSQFGEDEDRTKALRLFEMLASEYPSSSLIRQIAGHTARLEAPRPPGAARTTLRAIHREVLPDALRVTLELERETAFYEERLDGPPRVFVDLRDTEAAPSLRNATLPFPDDVVRQVRVGRQPDARTRVVLDLENAGRYSVYALYNPYRVVIDVERATPAARANGPGATWSADPLASSRVRDVPVAPPAANTSGGFSLSRQLGLGVSRIVIDPGHGGRDPGAITRGLRESEIVLDIALRLEALLAAEPGVEPILTRRTDVFVPLEDRTAIANRAEADLFLSIHVNAATNADARGIETYFLNFAPDPEAEAIAARENAGAARTMSSLPDIVQAIAMNNKIDESRDFAGIVQASMVERIGALNADTRDLGVKQAPFMVLIGATMPSVLAEVSFLTHREEGALLRTEGYRQQIAEALYAGLMRYQRALKQTSPVATR